MEPRTSVNNKDILQVWWGLTGFYASGLLQLCTCVDKPNANYEKDSINHVEPRLLLVEELKKYLDRHTQRTNITSESNHTVVSNQVLKQKKKECLGVISVKERLYPSVTSEPGSNTSNHLQLNENVTLSQGRWSLPHVYNLSTDPSADDQDGNVWR